MQKKLRPGLSRPSWPITKDFSNPARAHEAEGRDEGVLTTEASPLITYGFTRGIGFR
jgi:hypothetical protein